MSDDKRQVDPGGVALVRPEGEVAEPYHHSELAAQVNELIGALKEDMLPLGEQVRLFEAMTPTAQRAIIGRFAGLEANVLMVFQHQTQIVDGIMRRMFNEDGTLRPGADSLGMSPKDALNIMHKNTQVMVRDLPKIYGAARAQRIERAMFQAVESLPKEQQEAFLDTLQQLTSREV